MYNANVRLNLGKRAREYFKLLDKGIIYKRSRLKIRADPQTISIEIEAEDPIALIASLNSVLRQLRIIGNAERLLED